MEDAASTSAEKENATAPLIANTNFALDTAITKLAKDTDFSSELDRLKTTGNEEVISIIATLIDLCWCFSTIYPPTGIIGDALDLGNK